MRPAPRRARGSRRPPSAARGLHSPPEPRRAAGRRGRAREAPPPESAGGGAPAEARGKGGGRAPRSASPGHSRAKPMLSEYHGLGWCRPRRVSLFFQRLHELFKGEFFFYFVI